MTTFYLPDLYLYLRPSRSTIKLLLLKKVGSRGQCLLPSTFGKVEVEGTIFDFGFTKKFDIRHRDQQRSVPKAPSLDPNYQQLYKVARNL
jgi:hypothetical protein